MIVTHFLTLTFSKNNTKLTNNKNILFLKNNQTKWPLRYKNNENYNLANFLDHTFRNLRQSRVEEKMSRILTNSLHFL